MKDFTKDLMELFTKHNLKVLDDSTTLSFSPIEMHVHGDYTYNTRDISIKFTELILDKDIVEEHSKKYGCKIAIPSKENKEL